MEKRKQ